MVLTVPLRSVGCDGRSPNGMHTAMVRTMGLGPGWAECGYCGETVRKFANQYWVADCPVIREEPW